MHLKFVSTNVWRKPIILGNILAGYHVISFNPVFMDVEFPKNNLNLRIKKPRACSGGIATSTRFFVTYQYSYICWAEKHRHKGIHPSLTGFFLLCVSEQFFQCFGPAEEQYFQSLLFNAVSCSDTIYCMADINA